MIFWLNMNMLAIACAFYFEPLWAKLIYVLLEIVCLWFALCCWEDLTERVKKLEKAVHKDGH